MTGFGRGRLRVLTLWLPALACAPAAPASVPSEALSPWQRELRAYADTRRACVRSEECSIVLADCPLHSVAVSWGRADEVVAKRDAILARAGGAGCDSTAAAPAAPPVASCLDGQCELVLPTL